MYARDYRRIAHEKCEKYSSKLAIIYLIYYLIIGGLGVLSIIGAGSIATLIVMGPFLLSFVIIAKKVYNEQELKTSDLFKGFNDFGNSLALYIVRNIFVFLWSLLLIVPGIINSLSYSMSFYIHNDDRSIGVMDSIDKSKKLMNGHKWELFCLYFSYIGWLLLSCLTFGILLLWVAPKIEVAVYTFYLNISGKLNEPENNEEFVNYEGINNDDPFILSKEIKEEDDFEEEFKENEVISDDNE